MVRYWIMRIESPPAKFETASWFRPRKGKLKQVKLIILVQAARSVRKPSICKIMANAMIERSCKLQGVGERESGNEPDKPLLSTTHDTEMTGTMSSGQTRRSLFPSSDKSLNKTCPKAGIIYTQNMQGLSGKDKRLDSLVDPIVDRMITKGIMAYCIQETWVVGTGSKLVCIHMVFRHNQ